MKLCYFKALIMAFVLSFTTSQMLTAAPVDINTANAQLIASSLSGVGPAKAQAIITYRLENGPFLKIEELLSVKGIGPATVEKNRDDILIVSTEETDKK